MKDIQKALKAELSKKNPDFRLVIDYSSKIINGEKASYFSVQPSIINQLGRELVIKQESAVVELVKNSYDADAICAELEFVDTNKVGGQLIVKDNGTGMSYDDLVNGFMKLGGSSKKGQRNSPKFQRRLAGEKGIGRIAAQRLGNYLTVTTKKKGEKAYQLIIDWILFEKATSLASIPFNIDEVNVDFVEGTVLNISGLYDVWQTSDIKRIYKYLNELLQPASLTTSYRKEDQFVVKCTKNLKGKKEIVADIDQMQYGNALAVIDAYVDNNGIGNWSVNSSKLNLHENDVKMTNSDIGPVKFKHIKGVHLRAYYFIYKAGFLTRQEEKLIIATAKEKRGLRVYRNGFRVLPYGEPYDDWLKMDYSYANRVFLFPHQNINFFGFVEVIDDSNIFEETSSREGLIANTAYYELVDFGRGALIGAANRIAEFRGRKQTSKQKDWIKKTTENIKQSIENIEQVVDSLTSTVVTKERAVEIKTLIAEAKEFVAEQEIHNSESLEELEMLRVLASLGLTIGEFTHEMRHYLPAVKIDMSNLIRIIGENDKIKTILERIDRNVKSLQAYLGYFDKSVTENTRRERVVLEMRDVLNDFSKTLRPALNRAQITLEGPHFEGYNLFPIAMHYSEWTSVLFNLYTNAKKAIRAAGVKGLIRITASKFQDKIIILFEDNGVGIKDVYKTRVFDSFFTTYSPSAKFNESSEELTGTGLGLSIIKQIIDGYGGTIEVSDPSTGFNTCFKIVLPIHKLNSTAN